jgi:hypothetical protein
MGASQSMYRVSRSLLAPVGRQLHARKLWPPSEEAMGRVGPMLSASLAALLVVVRLLDARITRDLPVHPCIHPCPSSQSAVSLADPQRYNPAVPRERANTHRDLTSEA